MQIRIPNNSLIVLVGPAGSGKSTFAARHFLPTEVVSSDRCRAMICDDETSQTVSGDAFELVRLVASKRLQNSRLTVIDATSVKAGDRREWIDLARHHGVPAVAIVFKLPQDVILQQNLSREARVVQERVIERQMLALLEELGSMAQEGFASVHTLDSRETIESVQIVREE